MFWMCAKGANLFHLMFGCNFENLFDGAKKRVEPAFSETSSLAQTKFYEPKIGLIWLKPI